MCGLVGVLDLDRSREERRVIVDRALQRLVHRGPDGRSIWEDRRLCVGVARLAIRDPSAPDQPWRASDGSVVAFNGEVYDTTALAARLARASVPLRSACDTEALAEAIALEGPGLLLELDAMFGLALWRPWEGELWLARDRFGEKPLYYARLDGGGLAFASEPQALLAIPGVDVSLDEAAVAGFLADSYIAGTRTGWSGVRKVQRGQMLRWWRGQLDVMSDFAPRPEPRSMEGFSMADEAERVRLAVVESVRARLQSDRPVGLLLSGGIDSAAVAWAATEVAGPLPAWTVSWEHAGWDESAAAAQTAAHLGLAHTLVRVGPTDLERRLDDILSSYAELLADESLLPTVLVCEAAASKVDVLLTGDGGDELFGGYQRYGWRASSMREYMDVFSAARWSVALDLLGIDATSGLEWPTRPSRPSREGRAAAFAERRRFDLDNYLPDEVLAKVDRAAMRVSVENRAALLGRDLAERAMRLPLQAMRSSRRDKIVLREAMAGHLPPAIVERPKQGFGVPLGPWFRGPLLGWLRERLSALRGLGPLPIDVDKVLALADAHVAEEGEHSRLLFNLVVLGSWLSSRGSQSGEPASG